MFELSNNIYNFTKSYYIVDKQKKKENRKIKYKEEK
jgi:hypothetical protein